MRLKRPSSAAGSGTPRDARRRRRRGAALSVAALSVALPAVAGDQSIRGSVSQTFLGDTNTQLETGGDVSAGSISRLSLDYTNRTPSAVLSLGTGFSYSAFTDGNDDNISGLFPSVSGSYAVNRPTRRLNFRFSGSVRPIDYTTRTGFILGEDPLTPPIGDGDDGDDPDIPSTDDDAPDGEDIPGPDIGDGDDGDVDGDGVDDVTDANRETLRVQLSAGFSYNAQINSTTSTNFGLNVSRLDFLDNDGSLTPSTTLSGTAGTSYAYSSRTRFGVGFNTSFIMSEGDDERTTLTTSLAPSVSFASTPRLTFSGSLGPSVSYTSFETAAGRQTEVTPGLTGSFGMGVTEGPIQWNFSANQSVRPSDEGVAVNRSSLSFGYRQRIDATSSLSARAGLSIQTALSGDDSSGFDDTTTFSSGISYSRRIDTRSTGSLNATAVYTDDGGGEEQIFGVGAAWTYALTPVTNARFSYDFRLEHPDDLTSHRVALTLTRSFTLLP